jgi:hypothetical protein
MVFIINMAFKKFIGAFCLALLSLTLLAQHRYMVFANGYRGMHHDSETTANTIQLEPQGYWYAYDDTLLKRFYTDIPIYIDGHHPLATSSHKTKFRVYASYVASRFGWIPGSKGWMLNDKPNQNGYYQRFSNGILCGDEFLIYADDNDSDESIPDTLDIVCHSMGYAYTLGFLDQVAHRFVLGKILLLAPEAPTLGGFDWNRFQEVWQYGSNRGERRADAPCRQDGIAPQAPVFGIEKLEPGKGGRLFLPKNAPRGFVRAHHLKYYSWFYNIKPGDWGYFSK